jgi:PIN domain nuclease of toxin-antitoxin system
MKLLVDTHIFIWIFIEPQRFTGSAREFLEDVRSNQFFLSHASAWEASIKHGTKKLKLPVDPELFFPDRVRRAGYQHLRIDLDHVMSVHKLPLIHRDPFDRLLVSQALAENMTILSNDRVFKQYKSDTLSLSDIS